MTEIRTISSLGSRVASGRYAIPRGFTLIELMIVVAIIAILAAIAYPSYINYVQRTRRADGHEMLMRMAAAQERYYTNYNKYAKTADLGMGATPASEEGYYTVVVTPDEPDQTFVLTATPQGAQAVDACGKLVLSNTGVKTAPDDTGKNGKCW